MYDSRKIRWNRTQGSKGLRVLKRNLTFNLPILLALVFLAVTASSVMAKPPRINFVILGDSPVFGEKVIKINGTELHKGENPVVSLGSVKLTVLKKDADGKRIIVGGLPNPLRDGSYELKIKTGFGDDIFELGIGQ